MTLEVRRLGSASLTRALLLCGAAAGPLFVTVFVVEGARRSDYNPRRHPVSALSLGPHGWAQVANFCAAGTLYVAGAAGLFSVPEATPTTRCGSTLIGAAGLGLLGSAVYATDPVNGYPPGAATIEQGASITRHGIAAIPVVVGLPTAALAYAWRFHRAGSPRWAVYCACSAAAMVVNFAAAAAGFDQRPRLINLAGLFQRVSIFAAFSWITAMSVRAFNHCGEPDVIHPPMDRCAAHDR